MILLIINDVSRIIGFSNYKVIRLTLKTPDLYIKFQLICNYAPCLIFCIIYFLAGIGGTAAAYFMAEAFPQAPRFRIQNIGHRDFEPSKNEKKVYPPGFFCLHL